MNQKPNITIHYGATADEVIVDDTAFTRHKLSRPDQGKLRRIVVSALEKIGYFAKNEGRR